MPKTLQDLRKEIDAVDAELIHTLAKRFAITDEVKALKAREGMAPKDPTREARQKERYATIAKEHNLDPNLIISLFEMIIDAVVVRHRE